MHRGEYRNQNLYPDSERLCVIVFHISALYLYSIMMQNHCLSGSLFCLKGYPISRDF